MLFEFIDYEEHKRVLPKPVVEGNYEAWAKIHYGLMKCMAAKHPKFKVSNDPFYPTELYYGDDWFGIRKTAVVAVSWRAFCLEVAETIQGFISAQAPDWLVTFAVEGGRQLEVGNPQLEVLISRDRAWVSAYELRASAIKHLCQRKDVFAWLIGS